MGWGIQVAAALARANAAEKDVVRCQELERELEVGVILLLP
jgi:hypothetical protein